MKLAGIGALLARPRFAVSARMVTTLFFRSMSELLS